MVNDLHELAQRVQEAANKWLTNFQAPAETWVGDMPTDDFMRGAEKLAEVLAEPAPAPEPPSEPMVPLRLLSAAVTNWRSAEPFHDDKHGCRSCNEIRAALVGARVAEHPAPEPECHQLVSVRGFDGQCTRRAGHRGAHYDGRYDVLDREDAVGGIAPAPERDK